MKALVCVVGASDSPQNKHSIKSRATLDPEMRATEVTGINMSGRNIGQHCLPKVWSRHLQEIRATGLARQEPTGDCAGVARVVDRGDVKDVPPAPESDHHRSPGRGSEGDRSLALHGAGAAVVDLKPELA